MQENVVQSSGPESRPPAAGAHPGGSAVQREAARTGHRAAAGRPPRGPSLPPFFRVRLTGLSLVLQQFSDKHPESASDIKLTMAQLYLAQGDAPVHVDSLMVDGFSWLCERGLIDVLRFSPQVT